MLTVVSQIPLYVIVQVYVPAPSPVADALFCTGFVFHWYENGAFPPFNTSTVADPSFPLKQVTSFFEVEKFI